MAVALAGHKYCISQIHVCIVSVCVCLCACVCACNLICQFFVAAEIYVRMFIVEFIRFDLLCLQLSRSLSSSHLLSLLLAPLIDALGLLGGVASLVSNDTPCVVPHVVEHASSQLE